MHELDLTYSDSARRVIQLRAPLQNEYLNKNRDFPEGVGIVFYNSKEEPETTLNANYAKVNGSTGIYMVRGNVVIVNIKDKRRLQTEELYWNPKSKKIYTEKNVVIDQFGKRLMGKGLEAKEDFSSYQIKNLTGVLPLDEDETDF